MRLGQNLGELSGWKQPEKGVGRENRAKMASFWPVLFKIKRSKTTSFWPFLKMSKTTSFWSQKIKKEVRASLCPLQPDAGEEEKEKKKKKKKEKEKKEVGDRGAPVDRVAPCAPKRHLREGASPAFKRGARGWRRAARSLGVSQLWFTHKKKGPMVDNVIYCFLLDQLIITSMIWKLLPWVGL